MKLQIVWDFQIASKLTKRFPKKAGDSKIFYSIGFNSHRLTDMLMMSYKETVD